MQGITVRRLVWAGHARRKEGSLMRTVLENTPRGKYHWDARDNDGKTGKEKM